MLCIQTKPEPAADIFVENLNKNTIYSALQHQVCRVFRSSANRLDNLHFAGAMGNVL